VPASLPQTGAIAAELEFGEPPIQHRIGLLELATAETAERDFHAMLPAGAMFHTARVLNENPVTLENLRAHRSRIADATAALLPGVPLDVICYDCTSGTVAIGYDAIAAEVHRVRPGVHVVTPITAAIEAFIRLEARAISILTPYTPEVSSAVAAYFADHGLEVLNTASFMVDDDIKMARITPDSIRRAAIEVCADEADALFISCTALRAVETLEQIETALGRPVVSSIQAEFWQSIRLAGYRGPIDGPGALLREH
jgi:maleate isomerase